MNTEELAPVKSGWRKLLQTWLDGARRTLGATECMVMRIGVVSAMMLIPAAAPAQTNVDLRIQGKDVDFSGANSTRPAQTGSALPATCNTCTATNTWTVQGGGAASFPAMAVSAGNTAMTIGAMCSALSPCNVRVGTTVYAFASAVTATLKAGTGTAFVYVDTSGNLTVGHNFGAGNLTCSGACVALNGITAFPADSIPIWTWSAISGDWNANGGTDQRAFLSQKVVTCGTNLQCVNSGSRLTINAPLPSTVAYTGQSNTWSAGTQDFHAAAHTLPSKNGLTSALPSTCTVGEEYFATDAAAGQNKYLCTAANIWTQQSGGGGGGIGLTAPLVDFADHSSTATTAAQTLTSLTLPAGKMAANNNYAILAVSGLQATAANSMSLSFGGTTVLLGNNAASLGLGSGTTFTVECKVIRTASNAQKISCVTELGQNLAGPYVTFTTGAEDLTANVVVTVKAATNGNAGDVVLKTLEFRPVNF
jgi:hypothetical protein